MANVHQGGVGAHATDSFGDPRAPTYSHAELRRLCSGALAHGYEEILQALDALATQIGHGDYAPLRRNSTGGSRPTSARRVALLERCRGPGGCRLGGRCHGLLVGALQERVNRLQPLDQAGLGARQLEGPLGWTLEQHLPKHRKCVP